MSAAGVRAGRAGGRTGFESILFPPDNPAAGNEPAPGEAPAPPGYLADLNLDQLITAITTGRERYELAGFFQLAPQDLETIAYRQAVFRDLEDPSIGLALEEFAQQMTKMRSQLATRDKLHQHRQRQRVFVDVVRSYTEAVTDLRRDLAAATLHADALRSLRSYLDEYAESEAFTSLNRDAADVLEKLSGLTYSITIHGDKVTVRRYEGEADYGAEVLATFEKFRQQAVMDHRRAVRDLLEMNHIEAQVLEFVAQLFPEPFAALAAYVASHADYLDRRVERFERELHFYLGYLDYLAPLRAAGLPTCYPVVSRETKEVAVTDSFDVVLAAKLTEDHHGVVCNDFHLRGEERVLVVSGPNQGGKTTFARTFGQLHHLGNLGCPVAASSAHLYHFDSIFTHFGRREDPGTSTGKLEEDLVRIRDILVRASTDSIVVLNEIFTSTALRDAVFLGTKVLERVIELDLVCVWITFLDELATLGPSTVSMMSTVRPDHPAARTYKILRQPANGLAYALAIAEQHGVTYARLKERIGP